METDFSSKLNALLGSFDSDRDGAVTADERLRGLDSDGNGELSLDELIALAERFRELLGEPPDAAPPPAGGAGDDTPLLDELDLNGDGVITQDELMRAIDKNGDGQLSPNEIEQLSEMIGRPGGTSIAR